MSGLTAAHEAMLVARGLDPEMLATLGLASCDKRDGRDWIEIPFFKDGIAVNSKFRTIAMPGTEYEKLFFQKAGAEKIFYGHDAIFDPTLAAEPLIVCEGEPDRWSFMQAGFLRVGSVPDGAPQKPAEGDVREDREVKYSFLFDALKRLSDVKEIILATDDDGPGRILRDELAQILGRARCKWLPYPKGCKDANEVLQRFGVKGVKACVARAAWIKLDGVYSLSELPPADSRIAYPTGMCGTALDAQLKVRLGDVMLLTGIPGHGKSSFLNDLCCSLLDRYGWRTAFFSPEQEAASEHRDNLRQWFSREEPDRLDNAECEKADAWINDNFRFIQASDEDELNIDWLMDRAEGAIVRAGCKIVVIDPWNEMDHLYPNGMSETEYVGLAMRKLKRWARRHGILVVIAAHPKKMERLADGNFRMPSTYDINGSANFFNKCDVSLIVHRFKTGTIIRTEKLKNHRTMGKPGDLKVGLNMRTGRYFAVVDEIDAPLFRSEANG